MVLRGRVRCGAPTPDASQRILIDLLNDMIAQHRRNRAAVTDEIVDAIMTTRKLK